MEKITEIIYSLRDSYLLNNGISTYIEINSGLCCDFAEEVDEMIKGCEIISNDRFMDREDFDVWNGDKDDVWNNEILLEYGGLLPKHLTISELNHIIRGYHCWIYYNGKHYDAETPLGVQNLFDLPFFQRHLNNEYNEH